MSQAEIVKILKNEPGRRFDSDELAVLLGVNNNSVRRALGKARQTRMVGFEYRRFGQHRKYLYYYKGEK